VQVRLITGACFCLKSPVPVLSPTVYADVQMQTATTLLIPDEYEERAVYVLEGEAQLDGEALAVHSLAMLPAGQEMTLFAESDCHLVVFGGAPLDGPRRINWNFVASDPAMIELSCLGDSHRGQAPSHILNVFTLQVWEGLGPR
jgi:redox-sensitive bicupin YhaK (pirin superfamily)